MDISRGSGVALWHQIASRIEEDIAARLFPPGGRLPTENKLAQRFEVNRHTVRRAVAALEEKGLVRIEQGRGTFVQGGAIDYTVGKRTRFSENIRRQAREPSGQLIRAEQIPADPVVARALDLRRGTRVVLLETVGMADEVPISLGAHHFPAKRFPELIEAFKDSNSISSALAAAGVADYWRKSTRVTAGLPDSRETGLLEMPKTRPLLVCESVNVDQDGAPIEFGRASFVADRVQISLDTL
ncbi:MAG: phosphonate metabolism transcriptional regulator PhnF [Proteobacteria bacterium]|nr:phosphonate metabolism transcriptional regulator PhnF [Pseudomonadota bacterium]